jgi:hypothetical protein
MLRFCHWDESYFSYTRTPVLFCFKRKVLLNLILKESEWPCDMYDSKMSEVSRDIDLY